MAHQQQTVKSGVLSVRNFMFSAVALFSLVVHAASIAAEPADPLASWNEGANKAAIVHFVQEVTLAGGDNYVKPEERIAVFDNDGTLWTEQPYYVQVAFIFDRIRSMAASHPEWKTEQPFKGVLENDIAAVAATGMGGLMQLEHAATAGVRADDYKERVLQWLKTTRDPKFHRPYTELVYQPMLELLNYLRANGFKTYIVSGGGVDFMRPWTEAIYGIPPEQVIGSSDKSLYSVDKQGRPEIVKQGKITFVNDGAGKPVGIYQAIGRQPILAFGNSDGDLEMLQYVTAGSGVRLALYLHHDDDVREYRYDRLATFGKLNKGLDVAKKSGWPVVSMKNDWKTVFPPSAN